MKNNLKSGIYRWTNVHNGKVYIGEDKAIIDKARYKDFIRFNQYKYAGKKINDARKKYNHIEDWEYEVLEYCTPEERFDLEKYWVAWHKENGYTLYNLTEGGEGVGDEYWTEERRKECSERNKGLFAGEKNPMYGKRGELAPAYGRCGELSPMYGKCGELNPMWGHKHSEESKRKNGLSQPKRKEVYQFSIDGTFIAKYDSSADAMKVTQVDASQIRNCCSKKPKHNSAGGYLWSYTNTPPTKNKMISQYSLDGKLIKKWNTAKEAMDNTGVGESNISANLTGRTKSAGGFIWKKE